MKIRIVSVAYERPIAMRGLIDSLLLQTNPRWELTIVHDGKASQSVWDTVNLYNDARIHFFETEERLQQFGHPNRQRMIRDMEDSTDDFLLMTNDDNYYVPTFVEYMLNECRGNVGFVFCDSVHSHFQYAHHKTQVKEHHIDIGSFIVRVDIAKKVGFNNYSFSADGVYAEECYDACSTMHLCSAYIPKPLFVHN